MLKVKNLLNSAAFRAGIPMVSVKSTRILVRVQWGTEQWPDVSYTTIYCQTPPSRLRRDRRHKKFDFIDKRGILLYRPYGV